MEDDVLLIGIDIGTTNIKGGVFDPAGKKVASASRPTRIHYNDLGWADLYPDEIWEDVLGILGRLVSLCPRPERISALSFASFGEAGVAVDDGGAPLAPAIAWFDTRALDVVNAWRKSVDEYAVFRTTGMQVNHIPSLAKILWERRERPGVHRKASKWLFLASYILFRLSGEIRTEPSLASRSMLFDIRRRQWSEAMCDLAGISVDLLPPVVPSGTAVGEIRKKVAESLGLKGGMTLVMGGHDHACGAFSAGVRHQGDMLNSSGTVDILCAFVEPAEIDRRFFEAGVTCGCHVEADRVYFIGGNRSAGILIDWLAKNLFPGAEAAREAACREAVDLAARSPVGSNGVLVLPHFRGSSLNDPVSRGAILGLRRRHDPSDVFRAAFEGLSFELRLVLEHYQRLTARHYPEIKCIGGGSRNRFWTQMKADVLNRTLVVNDLQENASLGAAILAGLGAGIFRSADEAFRRIERREETFFPDPERSKAYERIYEKVYRDLAPQLAEVHRALAELAEPNPRNLPTE